MKLKPFILSTGLLLAALPLSAQSDGTYTIYPVPQEQTARTGNAAWDATRVEVVCEEGIDDVTRRRLLTILTEHGAEGLRLDAFVTTPTSEERPRIYLGINASTGSADTKGTALGLDRTVFGRESKYDRHLVSITASSGGQADIVILGENTNAAFYGLATLEQILDAGSPRADLACVDIYDYADQQNRGIIEGYYGVPYTAEVKKDLMRFMMRYKMNSYMYGAKSDIYHSTYWKDPYPVTITDEQRRVGFLTQDMVKDITATSHETKVNFIWAIHPGNAFMTSPTVVNDIMGKYRSMYRLGVRQFAVFVDDVGIPTQEAEFRLNADRITAVQQAVEREWNVSYTTPADTVKPIQFVPQLYPLGWADEANRKGFYEALATTPKQIAVYITGWGVWSVPNSSDIAMAKKYLGRDLAWWWNYPCNDKDGTKLFPMDMYSNFKDESLINSNATIDPALTGCLGILSNPMQQGEVSKIALFGVADYAWNNDAFDNLHNWEAAVKAIVSAPYTDALRTLCPYLRYDDGGDLGKAVSNFKATLNGGLPKPEPLIAELNKVEEAAEQLEGLRESTEESDRLFYTDIAPWLTKLKVMCRETANLARICVMSNEGTEKWDNYVTSLDTIARLEDSPAFRAPQLSGGLGSEYTIGSNRAEPANTNLRPLVTLLRDKALGDYIPAADLTPTRFTNVASARGKVSVSNNVAATNTAAVNLAPGEYYGIDLAQPVLAEDVTVSDTLGADFEILYSGDGREWTVYTDREAFLTTPVRYLCVRNASDHATRYVFRRNLLAVTLPRPYNRTGVKVTLPAGDIYDNHTADYLIDGNPNTFTCLNRNQETGDAYVVQLTDPTLVGDVRIYMGTVNDDYMLGGRVQVSTNGTSWSDLKVKGTNISEWSMSMPQTQDFSPEARYCDFVAANTANTPVRYVRFLVSQANIWKWLRFYEMEINHDTYLKHVFAPVTDEEGKAAAEVVDGAGYTAADAPAGSLTYHFTCATPARSLTLLQNAAKGIVARITLTVRDRVGAVSQTIDAGEMTDNVTLVDLTPYADRIVDAVTVSWDGGTAPDIYEIFETADNTRQPVVSGIERISGSEAAVTLRAESGTLHLSAVRDILSAEVYTLDGRTLLNVTPRATSVTLPLTAARRTVTLRATLSDGTSHTFKVIIK